MMSRRVWELFLSFLTILLAACGGDGSNNIVVTPPLATEVVASPSAQSQDVMVSKVRVTIPSGLLQTPQALQIVPTSQMPVNLPIPDMQAVGLDNISFQAAQTFDKPLVIEFPYDASTLGSDAADGKNLCASYLDEVRNECVRVEATVDKTRQKIAVTTDHMSNVLEEIIKANASCLALLPYTSPSVGSVFRSGEMHDSGLSTNGGSP